MLIVSRCLLISCKIVGSQVLGLNLNYAIHNCAVKKFDSSSHAHDLRDHAHWLAARSTVCTYTTTPDLFSDSLLNRKPCLVVDRLVWMR